jgi:hypothetical protein
MSLPFREIWLVDFEFEAASGDNPVPICLVALEYKSGRLIRQWLDGKHVARPPYPAHGGAVFVAYYASAELGCHLALGWPLPANVIDLFAEFRCLTNGRKLTDAGASLIGALTYFALPIPDAEAKKDMQQAIGAGTWRGKYSPEEILDYCESDVHALAWLLPRIAEREIDTPRALLRGRYMGAVAKMERTGTPLDVPTLELLRGQWTSIQDKLIGAIDADYGVYDGTTFKQDRFEQWLIRQGLPWARLDTGRLDLADKTFRQMAKAYPQVAPLRELRSSLAELRLNDLSVGRDGRNRTLLSPFRSSTGRNQPGNSKFIFGPSVWLRGLIKPPPGHGVAYVDWCQREFGIAAALSGDPAMMAAYRTGDPYLAFARQAGGQEPQRELFKQCALAVQYGMQPPSLALRVGQSVAMAQYLLQAHKDAFRRFWQWSDACLDHAMLRNELRTVFGWTLHIGADANPRSVKNFPMQANGAEMLRLACIFATEQGIEVCAPIHDAVLICAPLSHLDSDIAGMRECMRKASLWVAKFELRTDVKVVRYPDRYMDKRGVVMWDRVMGLMAPVPDRKVVFA